jgi:hypothetical protein
MIENNPTNVQAAFEMLLEEIEAEIDFINGVGSTRSHSVHCEARPDLDDLTPRIKAIEDRLQDNR